MGARKEWKLTRRFHRETNTPGEVSLTLTEAGELVFSCRTPEDLRTTIDDMHVLLAGAATLLSDSSGRALLRELFATTVENMRKQQDQKDN